MIKNRIISIRDINSSAKIDLIVESLKSSLNINDLLLKIASEIFSNFSLPFVLSSNENIISYDEYIIISEGSIKMISVRNVFDVEFTNSQFNSDVIFKFTNSDVYSLNLRVKRPDINRYKTELIENYIAEDPIVDNNSSGSTSAISTDADNALVLETDSDLHVPIADNTDITSNTASTAVARIVSFDSFTTTGFDVAIYQPFTFAIESHNFS